MKIYVTALKFIFLFACLGFPLLSGSLQAQTCKSIFDTEIHFNLAIALESKWIDKSLTKKQISKIDKLHFDRINNVMHGDLLLQNLPEGGAHLGVGGDFNYTIAGHNKSSQLVIYDIDPNVIFMHQILRAGILMSVSPKELIKNLSDLSLEKMSTRNKYDFQKYLGLNISAELAGNFINSNHMVSYLTNLARRTNSHGELYTWLGNLNSYEHVRRLYTTDQVRFGFTDQFQSSGFKTAIQDLKLNTVNTIYISNTLEYKGMASAGPGGNDPTRSHLRELSTIPSSDIVGILPSIIRSVELGITDQDTIRSFSILPYAIADLRDSVIPWNQFWKNIRALPLSSNAIIMSTSRENALFELVFQKYGIKPSEKSNWHYAQLNASDFNNEAFLNRPDDYAQEASLLFKKLLTELKPKYPISEIKSLELISFKSRIISSLIRLGIMKSVDNGG